MKKKDSVFENIKVKKREKVRKRFQFIINCSKIFCKKGVAKNLPKFTEKHLC